MNMKEVINDLMNTNGELIKKVRFECSELIKKSNKLHTFKGTSKFYSLDRKQKDLLYEQSRIMDKYIQILGKRIELLGFRDERRVWTK